MHAVSEQSGYLLIWWSCTIVLAIAIAAFGVAKSSYLTRWHALLAWDLCLVCLFYILRYGWYIQVLNVADYSINVFLDSMLSMFQLCVLSDANLVWLFEYTRFCLLTLVKQSSACPTFFLRPGFSVSINLLFRVVCMVLMVFSSIFYAAAETRDQDMLGRVLLAFWAMGCFAYGIYAVGSSAFLLSSQSFAKKKRRSASRVMRDLTGTFVYLPAFWSCYHLVFIVWAAISRSVLGEEVTKRGVINVQFDTHDAIKTPLMALTMFIGLVLRVRDYQEKRELVLFSSEDEEADDHATATNVAVVSQRRTIDRSKVKVMTDARGSYIPGADEGGRGARRDDVEADVDFSEGEVTQPLSDAPTDDEESRGSGSSAGGSASSSS